VEAVLKLATPRKPALRPGDDRQSTFLGTPTVFASDLDKGARAFENLCECNGVWSKLGHMTAGQWAAIASLSTGKPSSLYLRCTPDQHAYMATFKNRRRELAAPDIPRGEADNMTKLMESKFLATTDISEDEDTVVTIKKFGTDTFEGRNGEEDKTSTIAYFAEFEKGLRLNVGMKKAIVAATGTDETDEMKGKKLALFATTQEYGGQTYNVIRIKPKAPKGSAAAKAKPAAADDDDETPF
jgi:hypothetical protein